MSKMTKFIVGAVLVLILSLVGAYFFGLSPGIVYSDGHRSGVVYKFSKKGLFYKTWEGELSLGMNERDEGGNLVPRIFEFSVTSDEVARQLDIAEKEGRRVTLHYREYWGRGGYYGKTEYDILGVE